MDAPSIGTRLRAAMTEQGSSYTKLIAAMRRVAAARGEALPETRSLVTTLSRWFNDHERPSEFYQDLLCEALSKSRVQLGFDDRGHSEDEGGAEPEDLARVLESLVASQERCKWPRGVGSVGMLRGSGDGLIDHLLWHGRVEELAA